MRIITKSLVLSLLLSMSCKVFFDTLIEKKKWKYSWLDYTEILAFMLGFMMIALTEIPPYIIQPIRFIFVLWMVTQIYYRVKAMQNLFLSIIFCGLFWMVSMLAVAVLNILPIQAQYLPDIGEGIVNIIMLCLVLVFHFQYRGKINVIAGARWERFIYFPVFSLAVTMAATLIPFGRNQFGNGIRAIAIVGFGIMNMIAFYFIWDILMKEAQMQTLRISRERTQNQMDMYQSMQRSYEQQKRLLHDYKNQLNCIQGMLLEGKVEETCAYVTGLSGSLRKNADYVNTNHIVINVVLNQKYQYAQERNITVTMLVNDLSHLAMSQEDIVSILVNLFDNAIEACERLENNRVIQFKMVLEEGQLILSIRNPVKWKVNIKGNTVLTTKKEKSDHGIGLLNVNAAIKRNGGTSILKCDGGWFFFSAMIPIDSGAEEGA